MLLSFSTTTSNSQAATLWQIIYYFGESFQTVNPCFHVLSFCPSLRLLTWRIKLPEPLTARIQFSFICLFALLSRRRWGEKNKKKKLGKWSKSLRWKMFALKMSSWVMHFLYVSFFFFPGWIPSPRLCHSFAVPSPCGFFSSHSIGQTQVFADINFFFSAFISINNLEGAMYIYAATARWGDLETRRKICLRTRTRTKSAPFLQWMF